jgi:phage baseplate assembly protein gpV
VTIAALQNHQRLQALMAAGQLAAPKKGLVTSYDPENYAVKVKLQPSDIETGWLPIVTLMAGQGWGVYFGPAIGDQAAVAFEDGSVEAGFCLGFLPSDEDKPPKVPSGEGWIVSSSEAFLKLLPDGVIGMKAPGGLNIEADVVVTGDLTTTGDITDLHGDNSVTVGQLRDAYNEHHHEGVTAGSDLSGATDQAV